VLARITGWDAEKKKITGKLETPYLLYGCNQFAGYFSATSPTSPPEEKQPANSLWPNLLCE